ncbi:HPr family phosphocarrier protein [Boudabousia marimammalium]|uniref:Phosphocarrier protein HPr n=1 Tax=Boudabousia marimammalium TaxID=156892 RepID=A0A1Q5PM53_9ACTO|nr:HPr family phosphocarrier protein [Boudabousia marimammalium]OKL48616.1 serine kinase [Boudabousia marimammalium]
MASKTVKVGSKVGLHARPAALVAEAAGDFDDDIVLIKGDEEVDADSAMMIMTLGAGFGDEVTVSSDNEEAVNKIAEMIASDLDG